MSNEHDFQAVIDRARPDLWLLRVEPIGGQDMEPIDLPWPEKGAPLREVLDDAEAHGLVRVTALRVDNGASDTAIREARKRLRKWGPLEVTVDLNAAPPASTHAGRAMGNAGVTRPTARSAPPPTRPASDRQMTMPWADDPDIRAAQREAELLRAKASRAQAARELARIEREIEGTGGAVSEALRDELREVRSKLERPQLGAILASAVPVVQTLFQAWMESSSRREQMLFQVLAGGRDDVAPPPNQMETVLPLMRQLMEFAQELGGGGEKSQLGEIAELFGALSSSGIIQPGQKAAAPPAPPQPPSEGDQMKIRILKWLSTVYGYALHGADPEAVVAEVERPFLLLPREFRNLLMGNTLEGVLAGLPRHVPGPVYERLASGVRGNGEVRAWMESFLRELQRDDSDEDDDGQQIDEEEPGDDVWAPQGPTMATFEDPLALPANGLPLEPLKSTPPSNLMGNDGQRRPASG